MTCYKDKQTKARKITTQHRKLKMIDNSNLLFRKNMDANEHERQSNGI